MLYVLLFHGKSGDVNHIAPIVRVGERLCSFGLVSSTEGMWLCIFVTLAFLTLVYLRKINENSQSMLPNYLDSNS
jgi:hypothetical protein